MVRKGWFSLYKTLKVPHLVNGNASHTLNFRWLSAELHTWEFTVPDLKIGMFSKLLSQVLLCKRHSDQKVSSCLPREKPVMRQGQWEEALLCFGCQQLGEWADSCPKDDSPPPPTSRWLLVGKSFSKLREGATCRNRTVSSEGRLEIGHWWPDECPLDCLRYS